MSNTDSETALLDAALRAARSEGEAAGRAAAAAEAAAAKQAAEQAERDQAQAVIDRYAQIKAINPALAAAWFMNNQASYVAACRRLRGER